MFEEDLPNLNQDSVKTAAISRSPLSVVKARTAKTPAPAGNGKASNPARLLNNRPTRPFFLRKIFWKILAIFIIVGALLWTGWHLASLGQKIFQKNSPFSFLASFGQLFTASDRPVTGEDKGVVNILLLGIGGEGHEGANLTDTIILVSIKPEKDGQKSEVSLFSVPRDFIAKLPNGLDYRKINSAYAYGELKEKGLGAKWITDIMQEITGEEIPYYAVIDFTGFRQAIDDLGGVDVYIERSFSDSLYPDYRKGYLPTLKFTEGKEHMNGERALQFARSRHGTNNEGTDFARSRRQQKIIVAAKDKLTSLKLSSLSTISKLLNNFADHVRTNLEPWEIKRIYDLAHDIKSENIVSLSADPSTGIVCNSIDEGTGAYILTYCPGKTRGDLKQLIADRFTVGRLFSETAHLEIQNSTKLSGLAQRTQTALTKYNLETTSSNFPDKQAYVLTTIYDLSGGAKPQTLEYLKSTLDAYVATSSYPYADKLASPKPDFVLVLGTDAPPKIDKLLLDLAKQKKAAEPFKSEQTLK